MFSLLEDILAEHERETTIFPDRLPILPLRETVAYPYIIMPLTIGVARSIRLVQAVHRGEGFAGLVVSKEPDLDEPEVEHLYTTGIIGRIHRVIRTDDSGLQVIIQGLERFKVTAWQDDEPFITADIEVTPDQTLPEEQPTVEALCRQLVEQATQILSFLPQVPNEVGDFLSQVDEPRLVVYTVAANLNLEFEDQLKILLEDHLPTKMALLVKLMKHELDVLQIGHQIRSETEDELDKTQREFFLRQQMKAIQRELGEDEEQALPNEYRDKIEAAGLPEEAKLEAMRELNRLEKLPPHAAEYGIIQAYLDWMVELPWRTLSTDNLNIAHARDVLNADHHSLEDIKARILEYLAVRKLRHERGWDDEQVENEEDRAGGSILLFVGPPGVGKTSLGRSISRALGRKFTRMSLGGLRDEAEVRGHRRTYIGAMPGRIIQAIKRAESRNPVFMLDEVDKVGSDWRGDPSSALLEVLDPQQNYAFRDLYLDVDFDLSQVMFIATANTLSAIPGPLLDRMEIIEIDGYTEYDKIAIANGYLIPRQLKANGLISDELRYNEAGLRRIIRDYTREAGVRNLEREIGRVARKVATQVALHHDESKDETTPDATSLNGQSAPPTLIDPQQVRHYLGKPKFHFEAALRTERAGVVTGLAVTPVGGDVLFIEAALMTGKNRLTLTGQMGDVMKESAQIALSYVRAKATEFGLKSENFETSDIHLHVPAGAVPKDGPSAGVAMVTALVSAFTGRTVRAEVGMTGEISLQGQVLPIGGLKQKALAAHRAGLTTVIAPKRNEPDLDDLPEQVRDELTFILVDSIDEVLTQALRGETA